MRVQRPQYKHRLLDTHQGNKLQKKVNRMFDRLRRKGILFYHEKKARLQRI